MTRRMYRYEVPITIPTELRLTSHPLAFGVSADGWALEFWAENDDSDPGVCRMFRVIGTGHVIPDGAVYRGTAPRTASGLVWHLYEIPVTP